MFIARTRVCGNPRDNTTTTARVYILFIHYVYARLCIRSTECRRKGERSREKEEELPACAYPYPQATTCAPESLVKQLCKKNRPSLVFFFFFFTFLPYFFYTHARIPQTTQSRRQPIKLNQKDYIDSGNIKVS